MIAAGALLVAGLAAAPIVFDAREPARPRIAAQVAGQTVWLLVDTGDVSGTVLGPTAAARSRLPRGATAQLGFDAEHRAIRGYEVAVPVEVPGLGTAAETVAVSAWAEAAQRRSGARLDGVLAPWGLVRDGEALVVDFAAGQMMRLPWADAEARLATLPRALVDTPVVRGRAFASVLVDGEARRFIIDSGAPLTVLYRPRGRDLPRTATRTTLQNRTAYVAGFALSPIAFEEPIAPLDGDAEGLLGMDLLRRCAVALDGKRMLVRCHDQASPTPLAMRVRAPIRYARGPNRSIQVRFGGPRLEPYKRGWLWCGRRQCVYLRSDGIVERDLAPGRIDDAETREFLDDIAELRAELHQEHRVDIAEASLTRLPAHLDRLWRERRWTVEERRQFLFELWDECYEDSDREDGRSGAAARRIIEDFIQRELPRGSEQEFTDEELRRFNTRRGVVAERFAPYQAKVARR